MAVVMIGVDPHKASRTAVAISAAEEPPGQLRAATRQWPLRAAGTGSPTARQLPAAVQDTPCQGPFSC